MGFNNNPYKYVDPNGKEDRKVSEKNFYNRIYYYTKIFGSHTFEERLKNQVKEGVRKGVSKIFKSSGGGNYVKGSPLEMYKIQFQLIVDMDLDSSKGGENVQIRRSNIFDDTIIVLIKTDRLGESLERTVRETVGVLGNKAPEFSLYEKIVTQGRILKTLQDLKRIRRPDEVDTPELFYIWNLAHLNYDKQKKEEKKEKDKLKELANKRSEKGRNYITIPE